MTVEQRMRDMKDPVAFCLHYGDDKVSCKSGFNGDDAFTLKRLIVL